MCDAPAQNMAERRAPANPWGKRATVLLCEALQAVLGKQVAILICSIGAEQGYVLFSNFESQEGFYARQVWEGLHQVAFLSKLLMHMHTPPPKQTWNAISLPLVCQLTTASLWR
uniref:Uncharacterized protein n=1 Tax=Eutreptiella gymnastica TaxID=73025 RepID=A0A7S1NUD4_9EUGL